MPVATKPKSAPKPAAKKPAAKAAAPKATKASIAKATKNTPTTSSYKAIDVPAIVKRLKAGETMTVIRSEYGAGPKIRTALTAAGYNTKGEKIEAETISTNGGPAATAKRVAKARQDGWPWYKIAIATGYSETDLRALLSENGHGHLVTGRVSTAEAKPAKAAATKATTKAAKPAAEKPAAAKASKPAAKSAAKATKPGAKRAPRRAPRPQTGA